MTRRQQLGACESSKKTIDIVSVAVVIFHDDDMNFVHESKV